MAPTILRNNRKEQHMSWLCKLGLHDWVRIWDRDYGFICARGNCTATKPNINKETPRDIARRGAIRKFEILRQRGVL